jgi:hypothetical protein
MKAKAAAIFGIGLVVAAVAVVIALSIGRSGAEAHFVGATRPLPAEITQSLDTWNRQAEVLRIIHVLLAVVAIVGSVAGASDWSTLLPSAGAKVKSIAAISAAVSIAMLTGLDLGGKSNRCRRAWRQLNDVSARYAYNQTQPQITLKDVFDAKKAGEDMKGDVKENPQ